LSDNNYREMYVSEALEHVDILNDALLKLEKEPHIKEHVDVIFRSAHTIKGMAATMGYDITKVLCQNIENIFDNVRKGESKVTQNLASALFKCLDLLQQLISDEKMQVDLVPYLRMLEHPKEAQNARNTEKSYVKKSPTIRVKMTELDSLVNLVGELVNSKKRMEKIVHNDGSEESRQVMTEFDGLVTDLFYQSRSIRLVPIDKVFSRFTRLVRDTSKSLGKEVNLEMDGSGIELDRTILDAITVPLLHILRNCIDHGLETPDERTAAGKSPVGNIHLTAYREGDQIGIKIEDDGRGLNLDRIKAKAVEKGFISEEESTRLSKKEIIDLLGTPGLSTAKKVTDLSGRGVGMNIVIKQVEEVGGTVKITTEKGQGTIMILIIPLNRKQEIVTKHLSGSTNSIDSFTNATILPDGRIALILDSALVV